MERRSLTVAGVLRSIVTNGVLAGADSPVIATFEVLVATAAADIAFPLESIVFSAELLVVASSDNVQAPSNSSNPEVVVSWAREAAMRITITEPMSRASEKHRQGRKDSVRVYKRGNSLFLYCVLCRLESAIVSTAEPRNTAEFARLASQSETKPT